MTKAGRPRKERYARLMGGFWRNDKVRRLSLEACGLLAKAWSYAADHATDGRVPVEQLQMWAGKRFAKLMAELKGFLVIPEGAIDAQAHDWSEVNITTEEWEQKLERDRTRKKPRGSRAEIHEDSDEYPSGNPSDFQTGALDKDKEEDSLKREIARERAPLRDPLIPISGRRDVGTLHAAWKDACGFPNHKFRGGWDSDAKTLLEAIEAHGLEDCLLVARYAPNDGMVNGKRDEHQKRHDTIRYIFGNADAFNRILRDAQNAEGRAHNKSSAHDAIERARSL